MALPEDIVVQELLRQQTKLTAFAWSLLRDAHAADDLFQDVCLEAIRKRAEISDESHLSAWAMQAIRFRAVDRLRSDERHRRILSDQALDRLQKTWQAAESHDKAANDALRDCVAKLSDYAKQIVKLRYVDGLSGGEVEGDNHFEFTLESSG